MMPKRVTFLDNWLHSLAPAKNAAEERAPPPSATTPLHLPRSRVNISAESVASQRSLTFIYVYCGG